MTGIRTNAYSSKGPGAATRRAQRSTVGSICGKPPDGLLAEPHARASPLLDDLKRWLHAALTMLSCKSDAAAAVLYALKLWPSLTRYADDIRIGIDNSAAARALRASRSADAIS